MKKIKYEGRTIEIPQRGDKVRMHDGNIGVIMGYKGYFYEVDFDGKIEWCLDDQFKVV